MKFCARKTWLGSLLLATLVGCGSNGGGGGGGDDDQIVDARKADVIIAIDTSASMDDEIILVETFINDFVADIEADGIDVKIIMIADGARLCVPAPLGNGACPADENLPKYRHHSTAVNGGNIFTEIVSTYPNWKDELRVDASISLIVVTDDDSMDPWETFDAALLALDPPTFNGYVFHGFVASADSVTVPCNGISSDISTEYIELIADKLGVNNDLCLGLFDSGFEDMAAAVILGAEID